MPKGRALKDKRGPLTAEEKAEAVRLYAAGEHSFRDIAETMNSNPATISRVIHDAGVEVRKPGPSDIQRRNSRLRAEQRKREAEVRLANEIAMARLEERVNVKADQLDLGSADEQLRRNYFAHAEAEREARASVALDGDTQSVGPVVNDIVDQSMDQPRAEIRWRGETLDQAQDVGERIHTVGELLDGVGFFSGQLPHGHLVWQPTGEMANVPAPDSLPWTGEEQPTIEGLQAEHSKELERAHAWGKEQWAAGVRHGYEQATSGIVDLLRECMRHVPTESNGFKALEDFLEMLEDGEHFYRQHKDRKPWLNPENWR